MYTPGTVGISRISRSDRSSLETYNMITEWCGHSQKWPKSKLKTVNTLKSKDRPHVRSMVKKKEKKRKHVYIPGIFIGGWCLLKLGTREKKILRISFKFCHNPLEFRVHFNYFFLLERQNNIYSNQRCVFCLWISVYFLMSLNKSHPK